MGFEYGCFISYMRPEHKMMAQFVDELVEALESEFEPYLPKPLVYRDVDRLRSGHRFTPALGRALCASACWIVVYVPQYADHDYCLREFRAMRVLEERRRSELSGRLMPEEGMIIPVILRGEPRQLPDDLGEQAHCLVFNKFTTASGKILRNRRYVEEIGKLAPYVQRLHSLGEHLKLDCGDFTIPQLDGPSGFHRSKPSFPGHPGAGP